MVPKELRDLSRRERQIMDVLYAHQECSAKDVQNAIEDAPSYSAVRALITRLVDKDIVKFRVEGKKHLYSPKIGEKKAQNSAIKRLLTTFFKGSRAKAVTALLDVESSDISSLEIEEIERSIRRLKEAKK